MRSSTSRENGFSKRRAGAKKSRTFKEKRESVYPKLKDAGGFELLRMGSPNAKLFLINPPAGGYSVPVLWDTVGLAQALAYIRPLQMDLDTSVGESAHQQSEQVCVSIAATHNKS